MKPGHFLDSFLRKPRVTIHPALLILAGLVIVFGLILTISEPLPYQAAPPVETALVRLGTPGVPSQTITATVMDTLSPTAQFTPTQTSLPQEYLTNREQTIGIIIGTIMLVILVIGGTLGGTLARRREKK